MKFGMLTVIRRSPKNKGTSASWICVCDCGNLVEKDIPGHDLRSGNTKSCGCLRNAPSKFVNDLSDVIFNGISAIRRGGIVGGSTMWVCKCHCGKEFSCRQWAIRNGKVTSCGCLTKEKISKANSADLIGKRFGRLTVSKRIGSNKWRKAIWECECDCGNITKAATDSLIWGGILSCGCFRDERRSESHTTHGMTGTPEYNRSLSMRRREREVLYDSRWTLDMEIELRHVFDKCVVCGSDKVLSTAHVYSLVDGNGLIPGNATVLCRVCNSKQWAHPPESLPKSMPPDAGRKILESAQKFKNYWYSLHPEVV